MTFVDPNDLKAQEQEAAAFEQLVDAQLRKVADKTADRLAADQPVVAASMVDLTLLTIIGAEWETVVAGELLPVVEQLYTGASVAWTLAVAGALPGWDTAVVPPVSNAMAADYLAGARNRLVGIGDDLWANTRTSLLAGFEAGEDIPTLASRVRDAAGVTTPRANVIARTEVVGASNRGSFDTARLLGVPMQKVWMATPDDRTRPSHVDADRQEVPLDKPFTVGDASLEHPGDWLGPPEEVINCRCVIGYEIPDDTPPPGTSAALVAAGEDTTTMPGCGCSTPLTAAAHDHDGAMIALVPTEQDAARLALDGGEPPEELHLTLAYLGPGADWSQENREALHNALASYDWDAPGGTITGNAFGAAHWNPSSDDPAWVLNIGSDALPDLHAAVGVQLERARGEDPTMPEIPAQHKPWAAHLCITYDAEGGLLAEMEQRLGEITFDRLRIAFAGEATDIPLAGDAAAAAASPAAAATTDFQEEGEPEPGVPGAPPGPPCPPGQHRMPDGTCMDDEEMPGMADVPPPAPVPGAEHFHTVVTEGVSTGMRRFEEGALTWRTPPFAFHWEYSSAAHGGQMMVAQVGLVTRVVRDGNDIHFYGPLDLDSERGMEYARQLATGYARWSSVGLDEEAVEIEFVWPEGEGPDDAEDPLLDLLFAEPEEMIIKSGNIGEVTAVSVPALADATVEPTQALLDALADRGVTVASAAFGAVAPHDTATVDEPWDADAARDRLPSPLTVEQARAAFAWFDDSRVEDGELPKDAAVFIHHEVSEDGQVGAANLTACSNTIAILNGGRGVDTSGQPWSGDLEGIWEHVAAHLRDADREPPPLQTVSGGQTTLVAASHTITIPDVPPAYWFDEPTDVTPLGALTITDEGRVYGYLAPKDIAHRAYRDRRVTAPMGKVDYGRWMGGEALVAGGGRVVAGPITMECGHMSPYASSDTGTRMQHYDNACSVVAKARIGENRHGVWIAGALEPGVSPDQLSRMLACRLSGDWGPHPERPGWQEFVAALLVPVPGFAQGRSGPSVTVKEGALVASAVPVRLAGPPAAGPDTRPVLERLARQIGRDRRSRMNALRARVHNNQEVHDAV